MSNAGGAKKKRSLGTLKKTVAYAVFALVLTFFFVHLSFPSKIVRQYLEEWVEQRFPGLSVSIHEVDAVLPMGIHLHQTQLTKRRNPSIFLVKADSFVVLPSTKMLISGRPVLEFDCRAYGGRVQGDIFFQTFRLGFPLRSEVEFTGLRLSRYGLIKERLNRECSGIVSGNFSYAAPGTDPLQGAGQGDVSVINGSVRFAEPFLGLSSLDFDQININLALNGSLLSVHRINFKGPQITGEGQGTISLHPSLQLSGLDLVVHVKPVAEFLENNQQLVDGARVFMKRIDGERFTVRIRGTIGQPRTSFM